MTNPLVIKLSVGHQDREMSGFGNVGHDQIPIFGMEKKSGETAAAGLIPR
jgi:hypothetical protein